MGTCVINYKSEHCSLKIVMEVQLAWGDDLEVDVRIVMLWCTVLGMHGMLAYSYIATICKGGVGKNGSTVAVRDTFNQSDDETMKCLCGTKSKHYSPYCMIMIIILGLMHSTCTNYHM